MKFRRWNPIPAVPALITLLACSFAAQAAPSTPFAMTAANVTMPSKGPGASAYTITGIPTTGSLFFSCVYSGPATHAKIPYCGGGPPIAISVTEGQTLTGTWSFYPWSSAEPVDWRRTNRNSSAKGILSLAGVLLLGFGFRRRSRSLMSALLLAVCALAILPAISACGGNGNGMTPGTYPYTITAAYSQGVGPLSVGVSTTVSVTVP